MVIDENRKAILWSGIEKIGVYLANFTIQIILARLLCPNDYAVVAMLAIFFSISQAFIDSGFHTTLIQRQDCTQEDYSTVFYFNVVLGFIVYLLFYILSPYIENLYEFKGLAKVTKVYSLNLLINSFSMVHRAMLTKNLEFKKIAIITFLSSVLSAIPAIILAYLDFGYWSLVIQSLLSTLVLTLMTIYQSKWKPTFVFSLDSLRKLAPFGIKMLLIYLFHAMYNNIYPLLIGMKFPSRDLGFYDRAKTLSSMGPVGFSDFYTRALYPIQAKSQNDDSILQNSYNKSFSIICIAIIPITAYLFHFSEETVYTLFGTQWMECSWIIKYLTLGYMLYPLQALNMNMLKVRGYGSVMLYAEIIKKAVGIICVIVLINYDFQYVVIGWASCALFDFIISEVFYFKKYGFSLWPSCKVLLTNIIITFILALGVSSIIKILFDSFYSRFFIGGALFLLMYICVNYKRIKLIL